MMDITIGQYFSTQSLIHKMDPRTKILFTLFYMIVVFAAGDYLTFSLLFISTSLIIGFSRVPVGYYFKGLRSLLIIMLFTAVINLFLSQGKVVFRLPYVGWTITDNGIRLSVFMILRLTFLLTATSALTFTTAPVVLTDGIEHLLRPFGKIGFPAHEIAMMMTIALRFIPTFAEEADKIKKAQSARGADFESGNLFARAKAMMPVLVPLFISAFRRADDLAVAMESRCYHGGEGRTSLKQLKFTHYDIYALGMAVVIVLALIAAKVYT